MSRPAGSLVNGPEIHQEASGLKHCERKLGATGEDIVERIATKEGTGAASEGGFKECAGPVPRTVAADGEAYLETISEVEPSCEGAYRERANGSETDQGARHCSARAPPLRWSPTCGTSIGYALRKVTPDAADENVVESISIIEETGMVSDSRCEESADFVPRTIAANGETYHEVLHGDEQSPRDCLPQTG